MKKRFIPFVIFASLYAALPSMLSGQETLVGKHIESGGYGGVFFAISTLDDEMAMFTGWQGAWIVNKTFAIGWSNVELLSDDIRAPLIYGGEKVYMRFEYQGLLLGIILGSDRVVHFGGNAVIGWGRVAYETRDSDETLESDHFFSIVPEICMELNVTRWFRFAVSAGYRLIRDVQMENLSGGALSAMTGGIMLKFGKF